MKRILYISYDGLTDPLGQSQILPYLIKLSSQGYIFTIISLEKTERFDKNKIYIYNLINKSDIEWIPLVYSSSIPILSQIKNFLTLKKKTNKFLQKNSSDIIHSRSFIPATIGMSMKKKYKVKHIYDMRGFWLEERIEGKIWNPANPIYRIIYKLLKKVEKKLLLTSDHLITLTERAKCILQSNEYGITISTPITTIPCCVDIEFFNPNNIQKTYIVEQKKNLDIPKEALVLGYLGSIGTWYMLDEMMRFFQILVKQRTDTYFLFITNDSKSDIIAAAQKNLVPVDKIKVLASERRAIPQNIALMDYSVFFIRPTFSKKASSPTKLAEVLALGIPVICNDGIGDINELLLTGVYGWQVKKFKDEEYSIICEKMLNSSLNPQIIRNGIKEIYSLDQGVEAYQNVYRSLSSK